MFVARTNTTLTCIRKACTVNNAKTLLRQSSRSMSSTATPLPLFLWLADSDATNQRASQRLLLPTNDVPSQPNAFSPNDVTALVNKHYEKDHFVGGMGESDPGVCFAAVHGDQDTLAYGTLIKDSIEAVRMQRHGVPFGLYSSGAHNEADLTVPLKDLGVDWIEVTLVAATPRDYEKEVGIDQFGLVCSFVADAAEQGIAVHVGVLQKYATDARELAKALGGQNVIEYETLNKD